MSAIEGYGVVYTPQQLSSFVARILVDEFMPSVSDLEKQYSEITVLDPACGEASLLKEIDDVILKFNLQCRTNLIGVDVDSIAISRNELQYNDKFKYNFYNFDALIPNDGLYKDYWRGKLPHISIIIANPPWSAEKIYDKSQLQMAGYTFDNGQYDSYVLFIEMCLNIVSDNGYCAFILPDSIFAGENRLLRKYLAENTELCVIARLGEKLFANVNRATSVIILKKSTPSANTHSKCFRLTTAQRKSFLSGKSDLYDLFLQHSHSVLQTRFSNNANYTFDIDTHEKEEELLRKIEMKSIDWSHVFHFGRGVEISKKGEIVICPHCNLAQGFSKKQAEASEKICIKCGQAINVSKTAIEKIITDEPQDNYNKIFVGENVHRYNLSGAKYLKMDVAGINYKSPKLYAPPKILIRKTGLGINACIDFASTYISQTVYSCSYLDSANLIPIEYYLAVLNSRLMFYYYLKAYGENEWKSHPYLTKDIIFTLPLRGVSDDNINLCLKIAELTKVLLGTYSKKLDMEIEKLILDLYDVREQEYMFIKNEINRLPDLGAINHMKI